MQVCRLFGSSPVEHGKDDEEMGAEPCWVLPFSARRC